MTNYKNIDEYIATFPEDIQKILQSVRQAIHEAVPGVEEKISYGMPAFRLKEKNLMYFAGFKNHIGLYPLPSGIENFKKDLSVYKQGKGSVQFPINQPMPLDLIKKVAKFRAEEILK